jgi:RNA polymerase sigma factor (sigma-70 family)
VSTETPDKEILALFANKKTQYKSFELLTLKYQKKIYWQVRRMVKDHEDADDLVQEVFIKIWKNLEKFREDAQLSTWIYRIAVNETLKFIKKKQRLQTVDFDDVKHSISEKLYATNDFSGDHIQKTLQAAIDTLPTKQKLVFNLKYFEELKYDEISEMVGTSVGALKTSYHIAVKKIEKFVKDSLNQ